MNMRENREGAKGEGGRVGMNTRGREWREH